MHVTLALETDYPAVRDLAEANVRETRPEYEFDELAVRKAFLHYLADANPTCYVTIDDGEVIGFMLVSIGDFKFTSGQYLLQEVMYVRPDRRGSRAAALMVKHLLQEAERLEVREIVGGNDNSFRSEQTARFLEKFGFQRVGFSMRRVYG